MKKISAEAKRILTKLDSDTVFGIQNLNGSLNQKDALMKVIRYLLDVEQDYIIALDSADENLKIKHANSKGRMGSITLLMHVIEGADEEIERREKDNG